MLMVTDSGPVTVALPPKSAKAGPVKTLRAPWASMF